MRYERISKALVNCGYPTSVIRGVKLHRNTPKESTSKPKDQKMSQTAAARTMLTGPYVNGLSEKVQRVFRHGVQCALKPNYTLRSVLVRPKDSQTRHDTSHLVYNAADLIM